MAAERINNHQADIDYAVLLSQIEEAAQKAGIDLRYENLADDDVNIGSGICCIRRQLSLIVDKRLDLKGKLYVIAKELSRIDTDSIYMPPLIREFIESAGK